MPDPSSENDNPGQAGGFAGTWNGEVWATGAAEPHRLTLVLQHEGEAGDLAATMSLHRATPDPVEGGLDYGFEVHVELREGFIGLLAKDKAGLGINAMVLKPGKGGDVLQGQLVFNNIQDNKIEVRAIEWKRQRPAWEAPCPDGKAPPFQ